MTLPSGVIIINCSRFAVHIKQIPDELIEAYILWIFLHEYGHVLLRLVSGELFLSTPYRNEKYLNDEIS